MTIAPIVFKDNRPLTAFESRVRALWRKGLNTADIARTINDEAPPPDNAYTPRLISEAQVYNTLAHLQDYKSRGEIS